MLKNKIPFARSVISEDAKKEVLDCIDSGWLTRGPRTSKFEEMLAHYLKSKKVVAVNSGTSALHTSLAALNIGPRDEVITTPMTWPATSNVVIHQGATPVFADIQNSTLNIDPEQIRKLITDKTKAILPVHLFGQPCSMDEINEIAEEYDLYVVEDAAHALEAEYKNKKIGSIGTFSCFSFYPNKNITTGEGGAISTNDEELAERAKLFSTSGIGVSSWNKHQNYHDVSSHRLTIVPGFKYNMFDLQASLGIHQINNIDKFYFKRETLWKIYDDHFNDFDLINTPVIIQDIKHARHLYAIRLNLNRLTISRDEFTGLLKKNLIDSGIHYISISKHPYYAERYKFNTPVADQVSNEILSLPFSHGHTEDEINYVAEKVKELLSENRK